MPAAHEGKHRIIASKASNIISERSGETSSAAKGGDIIAIESLVQLLVFGRNGYMEILPIALVEVELFVLNYTKFTAESRGAADTE